MTSTSAPHLAKPTLHYLSDEARETFSQAVCRGFLVDFHNDTPDLDRQIYEAERSFGFQVNGEWISTCGAFTKNLTLPGGTQLPVAAVTQVTVSPAYRRRGLLTQMMRHQLTSVRDRGEALAILWASESLIYGRFGYGAAIERAMQSGQTRSTAFLPSVDLGAGSVIEVGREEFLTAAPKVHQSLLPRRPGALDRNSAWWQRYLLDPERGRDGQSALRFLLHSNGSGKIDGYATFRAQNIWKTTGPAGRVIVNEVDAGGVQGYARLWRYLLDLDLVREFERRNGPVDDRLRHLVADPRAIKTEVMDAIFVRILDVSAALQARRYVADADVVIELKDPLFEDNNGRYRLRIVDGAADVTKARRKPDLSLGIRELSSILMGGTRLSSLHHAGQVTEHKAGTVDSLSIAFGWIDEPYCPDHF